MSFGIHRLWKRFTIDCSGVRRGRPCWISAAAPATTAKSALLGETGKVVLAISMNPCSKWDARSCVYRCDRQR
ncbi:class I SAM-dependent methyltransferase [Escherichia coli]